jgi:hypothetical protein
MNKYIINKNTTYQHKSQDNDLTQDQTKELIDYIYNTIDIGRYRFKILDSENDLQFLDVNKYIVSANFNGPNCLLVFIKIKDKFYSYLIDRKTLSYVKEQINLDNLRTNRIRVALEQSIYNGTIFDGILVQNGTSRTYIITDCYYFRGKDLSNDKLIYKMMNIKSYLDVNYDIKSRLNTINLELNNTYELSEIDRLINIDIPKTKNTSKIQIRGLTFYPILSGTKLIFLFNSDKQMITKNNTNLINTNNNTSENIKKNTNINISDSIKKKTKISYVCKTDEPIYAILDMKKTDIIDVYKLFAVDKIIKDGKEILKTNKMGIAYIPTEKCSTLCKTLTSTKPTRLLMKCQFIQEKNKWMPIEEEKIAKIPTLLLEIEKKMDIIEEIDSDSD